MRYDSRKWFRYIGDNWDTEIGCVVAFSLPGKNIKNTVNALKHLEVNLSFVIRTIKRYNDTAYFNET